MAASKAYGEALMSNEPRIKSHPLYAMISGMRVGCWPRTIECAEKVSAQPPTPMSDLTRHPPAARDVEERCGNRSTEGIAVAARHGLSSL